MSDNPYESPRERGASFVAYSSFLYMFLAYWLGRLARDSATDEDWISVALLSATLGTFSYMLHRMILTLEPKEPPHEQ